MDSLKDLTPGAVGRWLVRYRPFLAVVAALLALAVFLPGDDESTTDVATPAADSGGLAGGATAAATPADGAAGAADPAAGATGGAAGGARGAVDRAVSGGGAVPLPAGFGPDCDPATGRIKVPANSAVPCVPVFKGNNGGATYQGVTDKTIKVVYYRVMQDAAVEAALTVAGANNSRDDVIATHRDFVTYFNAHYELYGRKVVLEVKDGSGDSDDDAAARADAIDVATRMKPFAVVSYDAGQAFAREMASRKVLCLCTTSQPQEVYNESAPYVGYTTLMSSTQGYVHRAEYVGKRLARRPAAHAGTATMQATPRVFGLLYYETPTNSFKQGIDFFERELTKYGVTLKARLAYPSDYAQAGEQARPLIQKLKDEGVTSVIFSGDPIAPSIFTHEATNQQYFPEWIVTGSALTDTSLFARTYDTLQWQHAFGISFLSARVPEAQTESYRVHLWHFGRTPTADNQYTVIYPLHLWLFTGLTLAGPNVTPQSWQKGLFSYPVTNAGKLTSPQVSFGNHGVWPFTDYTANDDVSEIWWDADEVGPDELDNTAAGMYRYVDGGRRYLPGQHPTSAPKAFTTDGSVTIYQQRPAADGEPPQYPRDPGTDR